MISNFLPLKLFTNFPLMNNCLINLSLDISIMNYRHLMIDFSFRQIKLYSLMNRSFDQVITSQLNRSISKQTHRFSKAERFKKVTTPPCIKHSYDLSATTIGGQVKKHPALAMDKRFKVTKEDNPSPNTYNTELNQSRCKGIPFGKSKAQNGTQREQLPGPGAYSPNVNPEVSLSYTMRARNPTKSQINIVGPGRYHVQDYETVTKSHKVVSKYTVGAEVKIGTEKRFPKNQYKTVVPGPGAYEPSLNIVSSINLSGNATTSHSFGRPSKTEITKFITPGPGAYLQFSEFSERANNVFKKLSQIEQRLEHSKY